MLARMAAHLRPAQVMHRTKLRAQRTALGRWPQAGRRLCAGPDPASAVGWPARFNSLETRSQTDRPTLTELDAGKTRLLGVARDLGDPPDWQQADAPLLWRFHLHYWDWAWGLATDLDRSAARTTFARLWRSWLATGAFGQGDAWYPYPAALRAWSWCGLHRHLVAGGDIETRFVEELALHAGFLRWHLESDVRGNHLVKDLKALVGLAVFFADERLLRQALRRLTRQLGVQVLPDGGHYERSPAYHCQVLADLIDVAALIRAAGHAPVPEITGAIIRMRRWLGIVLSPAAELPMLNDGYPVAAALISALRPQPPPPAAMLSLPDTGLVRADAAGWHLLADVGEPCPPGLPGHAHAGTLGCVLHYGGAPLLVDTGTSTYEAGPMRAYERSTAAHNTVQIDDANSTEVWGAFRAGRRARVRDLVIRNDADGVMVEAVHDGFRGLPGRPCHRRRWSLTSAGLGIDDVVIGRGQHLCVIRWHLAPGSTVGPEADGAVVTTPNGVFLVTVATAARMTLHIDFAPVAAGFLCTSASPVLTCRVKAVLPVRVITRWRQIRGPDGVASNKGGT